MNTSLSIKAAYAENGYVSPVGVMSKDEASELYNNLLEAERSCGGRLPAMLNAKAHLLLPFLWSLVHDDRIVAPIRALLGPDILCWGSSFFSKSPNSPETVPLHQDCTVWGLNEPRALTVWLAFTPSTEETGCMQVVPGTHFAPIQHVVKSAETSMLPFGEETKQTFAEDDMMSCPLAPGEMSIHHALLVHGSKANRSKTDRRVGFAIRYIAGDVYQLGNDKMHATLICGKDHGNAYLEVPPVSAFSKEALTRHRRILSDATRFVAGNVRQLPREVDGDGSQFRS